MARPARAAALLAAALSLAASAAATAEPLAAPGPAPAGASPAAEVGAPKADLGDASLADALHADHLTLLAERARAQRLVAALQGRRLDAALEPAAASSDAARAARARLLAAWQGEVAALSAPARVDARLGCRVQETRLRQSASPAPGHPAGYAATARADARGCLDRLRATLAPLRAANEETAGAIAEAERVLAAGPARAAP